MPDEVHPGGLHLPCQIRCHHTGRIAAEDLPSPDPEVRGLAPGLLWAAIPWVRPLVFAGCLIALPCAWWMGALRSLGPAADFLTVLAVVAGALVLERKYVGERSRAGRGQSRRGRCWVEGDQLLLRRGRRSWSLPLDALASPGNGPTVFHLRHPDGEHLTMTCDARALLSRVSSSV